MKSLFLLRHAKSSWDDVSLADRDRPLAPRGKKAAPKIGHAMAEHGWLPECALVSPATRTRQTWKLVASELANPPAPTFPEALYPGTGESLLAELRAVAAGTDSVVLVAHNPAVEELARMLAGPDSVQKAMERLDVKFPTGALARFEFEGAWDDLAPGRARLTDLLRPRDLD